MIIPHGGGAIPFHWGRYRGLALQNKRTPIEEMIKNNVFFDTCVYHLPGVELLTKVVPIDNILFASEMIGAVQIVDPNTGNYFDDTKRYVDGVSWLTAADKQKIYEDNIKRVYPGVAKRLAKVAGK
jgi:4-oxalmesaconate hydratase